MVKTIPLHWKNISILFSIIPAAEYQPIVIIKITTLIIIIMIIVIIIIHYLFIEELLGARQAIYVLTHLILTTTL